MPGALEDIRVIDFTHALNGPFCTMMLGHMGAEIIKIEPPAGDGFRRSWMPPNSKIDGYEFLWINANKKSVVLNLKDCARGRFSAPANCESRCRGGKLPYRERWKSSASATTI